MCLIICAISSEASRESFKLGLSVCLEYLLMAVRSPLFPPMLGRHTVVKSPSEHTLAWETAYKHTHLFGHMGITPSTKGSTFTGAPSKALQFSLNYPNQRNVGINISIISSTATQLGFKSPPINVLF